VLNSAPLNPFNQSIKVVVCIVGGFGSGYEGGYSGGAMRSSDYAAKASGPYGGELNNLLRL
jgi:hypothetical protein